MEFCRHNAAQRVWETNILKTFFLIVKYRSWIVKNNDDLAWPDPYHSQVIFTNWERMFVSSTRLENISVQKQNEIIQNIWPIINHIWNCAALKIMKENNRFVWGWWWWRWLMFCLKYSQMRTISLWNYFEFLKCSKQDLTW